MSSNRCPARCDRAQATAELALILPLLVLMALLVIQAGVLVRDQILVTHAAREGARAAALDPERTAVDKAVRAAGPLDPKRLSLQIRGRDGPGSRVTVSVSYAAPTGVPLLRNIVGQVTLHGEATML